MRIGLRRRGARAQGGLARVAASLALVAVPVPAAAQVGPIASSPVDARSAALASAVTADVEGVAAVAHNPAGIGWGRGVELGLAQAYVEQSLEVDGAASEVAGAHRLSLGVAATGQIAGAPTAFGVLVQAPVPNARRVEASSRWERYDPRASTVHVATALALRPHPRVAVGLGLVHVVPTSDRRTAAERTGPPRSPGLATLPQLGVQVVPSDRVRVGLALRGGAEARFRGDERGVGEGPLVAFVPPELALGASLGVSTRIRLLLDLSYLGYAALARPSAGASPPDDARDRVAPRLGLEWSMPGFDALGLRIPVRVGYALESSPFGDAASLRVADAARHTASVGCGIELAERGARLDLHARFGVLPERLRVAGEPPELRSAAGTQSDLGWSLALPLDAQRDQRASSSR